MDTAGTTLREPDPMDWDNYNPGSRYKVPPQVKGPDGKALTYYGQLPPPQKGVVTDGEDTGLREYLLDPIKLVKSGPADGYEIRYTRASIAKFYNKRTGQRMNASRVGNILKAAGIQAKPQTTAEYDAAMARTAGKVVPFTIEWYAKSKETGESVRGWDNFPDDPEFPGRKKAVLKTGDQYRDADGVWQDVKSEILFANAQVRYFIDPNRK